MIQRHQFRVGFSAFADGVFKRFAVLQHSLAVLAGNVLEERLGLFLVLAGSEDAAAGDADKSARILVLEIVQGGVLAVFPGLGLIHQAVIVVDHTAFDLPGIHRLEYRAVAPVAGVVGFHPLEPFQRGGFTLLLQDGRDYGLEVSTAWRRAPATFPAWVGQVHDRFRQVGFREFARIVHKHRGTRGDPDPFAVGRTIGRVDLLLRGFVDRCEQPGVVDQHHGRGVFGQEYICRRGRAFLHDLIAHFGVIAVAQGDRDTGFLGKALDPGLGQACVLRVVHHDADGVGCIGLASAQQSGGQQGFFQERRDFWNHSAGCSWCIF
ncbi:hypothetical protein D3C75_641810 [compost metagenome]